jgi:hypothetical protein
MRGNTIYIQKSRLHYNDILPFNRPDGKIVVWNAKTACPVSLDGAEASRETLRHLPLKTMCSNLQQVLSKPLETCSNRSRNYQWVYRCCSKTTRAILRSLLATVEPKPNETMLMKNWSFTAIWWDSFLLWPRIHCQRTCFHTSPGAAEACEDPEPLRNPGAMPCLLKQVIYSSNPHNNLHQIYISQKVFQIFDTLPAHMPNF